MALNESGLKTNNAMLKLCKQIGTPVWFQRLYVTNCSTNPEIFLVLNTKKVDKKDLDVIPEKIDDIPVRIVYKSGIRI